MTNSRNKRKFDAAGNVINEELVAGDDKQAVHQRTQAAVQAMNKALSQRTYAPARRPISASSSEALDIKMTDEKNKIEQDAKLAASLQRESDACELELDNNKKLKTLAKSDTVKPAQSAALGAAVYKNPTSILDKTLTSGVENILFRFLNDAKDLKTATAFVQTSKPNRLSNLFKQKTLNDERDKRVKELCQAVVYGEFDKVKAILEKNPSLVLYKARVQDYSYHETDEHDSNGKKRRIYRESKGTAYQLALAADDVNRAKLDENNKPVLDAKGNIQILHSDEGMAEMIQGYFIKAYINDVKAADVEIRRQYQEQFPADYQQIEAARRQSDSRALSVVIQAINDANVEFINGSYQNSNGEVKVDAKCEAALKQFREYLVPKGVITFGKHFNVELLIEAFQLYSKKYNDFGRDYSPKNVLFWRKIIGYIQRYVPACLAQVLCFSLYDVVSDGDKLERTLVYDAGHRAFFPLDLNPLVSLGVDFAHRLITGMAPGYFNSCRNASLYVENLCKQKITAVANSLLHPGNQLKHACVMK